MSDYSTKYLVWVLTAVGLASGGLMLTIVGWSLFGEINDNRLKQHMAQKDMARLLNSVDTFMDDAKSVTGILLTGVKTFGDAKVHLSPIDIDKDALLIQSYSMEFNALIDDMSEITLKATDLYGQCAQYSQQSMALLNNPYKRSVHRSRTESLFFRDGANRWQ